ncbi:ABC transporter permease [Paenalkalicoccus suaedae]|uniref:ABC transporter permease n=1 Tax=Paenalkalicoccus suaedae TaxID=2592382 RepID=A0A859FBC7_9BACI|nr:ABC transporter permease [Paenalkalicoccus suaedae]QKS69844.1 ABC transporter permease [Paenalkalicoccus suaedae]
MIDVLHAEFHKFKGMFRRYYVDSAAEIVSYLVLFIGLFYTIFQTAANIEAMLFQLLIGIFIWYVGINSIAVFTFILQEEMQLGTLEQIYLTKTSLTKMLFGRAFSTFIFDAIGGIVLALLTFTVIITISTEPITVAGLFQSVDWLFFAVVIALTMVGIYGFSFMLAGLSIVFKRISAITVLLNYAFLFFTGITLAEGSLPFVIDLIAKQLPITYGVINLNAMSQSQSSLANFASTEFVILVAHSISYMIIGLLLFHLMLNVARKNGNLGHY